MPRHATADSDRWLSLPWDAIAVHYSEIALKGLNRHWFIETLRRNLLRALGDLARNVTRHHGYLFVQPAANRLGEALAAASQVMGVAYVVPVRKQNADEQTLAHTAIEAWRVVAGEGASFAVRARGLGEVISLKSIELERRLGAQIQLATHAPVDLEKPTVLLRFRAYNRQLFFLGPRSDGPFGLPVGVSGRVLTLFSGGIDSPAAAWLMLRRGCLTDFFHVHNFGTPEKVLASKIVPLLEKILAPQNIAARLFLVPYDVFQIALLGAKVDPSLEVALFRRFLVRVANRLASDHGHLALVTGDNLAQVASQTLEGIAAVDDAAEFPMLRPLLTCEKSEIIRLAERIGTFVLATQDYPDCCSLAAKRPATRPRLQAIREAEATFDIDRVTDRALAEMRAWKIQAGQPPERIVFSPKVAPISADGAELSCPESGVSAHFD